MIESLVDEFAEELDAAGYLASWASKPYDGSTEFELYCPRHEDPATSKKPSATWQPKAKSDRLSRGVFHCHKPGCEVSQDANEVRAEFKRRIGDNVVDLDGWSPKRSRKPARKRGHARKQPDITDESFEKYAELLHDMPDASRKMLKDKGIQAETLARYEWGWSPSKDCFIFPVRTASKAIHGARLYDPFHPARDKKRWYATESRNSNALYGLPQAQNDKTHVVLFEGETDTMLAHQDGLMNAISQTGGAGNWRQSYNWYFQGKIVYICYDCDDAGRAGRVKVSKSLQGVARAVRFVEVSDGDYCEWRAEGHTYDEFLGLMAHAEEDWRDEVGAMPREGKRLSSVSQLKDVSPNKVSELQAYIAGKSDVSYDLPREVVFRCNMDQGSKCDTCPLGIAGGEMRRTLRPDEDDELLELMEARSSIKKTLMRQKFGMRCGVWESENESQWYVEQVSLQDPVDNKVANSADAEFTAHHFYSDDTDKINTGDDYIVLGRTMSDPRNSRLSYVVWGATQSHKDLDDYRLDESGKELLANHRPRGWRVVDIQRKLRRKYRDLSNNVTGIVGRDDLHLMYDLVAHSVTEFRLNGRMIQKGWLDAIVMGDTRTGKTEVARTMNQHYMSGYLVSGENASYAGLVGGSAEMAGRAGRIALWGVLPRHDRRFVQIDEAGGMRELLPRMSSIRSSGIAEVNKQGGGRTSARTRLLWLSNPTPNEGTKQSRSIRDFRGGAAAAIMSMVGTQEDVARFDIAMSVASDDVSPREIHSRRAKVANKYSSETCHEMVMFAWSRSADEVEFDDGVEDYISDMTQEIASHYSESPPLIQVSDFNNKMARMAVSLAVLTYSTREDGETVVVRKGHVKYITKIIRRLYDNPLFGYGMTSQEHRNRIERAKEASSIVEEWLAGGDPPEPGLPTGTKVLSALKQFPDYFDARSFGAACGMMEGESLVNYFAAQGLMRRTARYIDVMPELHDIVREL